MPQPQPHMRDARMRGRGRARAGPPPAGARRRSAHRAARPLCVVCAQSVTRSPARSRALVGTRGVRDVYASINKYALLLSMIGLVLIHTEPTPYGLTHTGLTRERHDTAHPAQSYSISTALSQKSRMSRPHGHGRQRRAPAAMAFIAVRVRSLPSRVHTVMCSHEGRRRRVRRLSLRRS